jgi:multidrug resistance efflux pump
VYIERAGQERHGNSLDKDVARRLYGMSKESLIIPMIVLLAAAGLPFGVAGYLTGSQGNCPDPVRGGGYLRADMTPLNTRTSGAVRNLNVNDHQRVKSGRTFIELGDEDDRAPLNPPQVAMAAKIQWLQLRQQAFALAVSNSFLLMATCCVACLVVVSFMSRVPTQYRQVTAAPVGAK